MSRFVWLWPALLGLAGCTQLYDFDAVEDNGCPCSEGYVCVISSDQCVRAGSVEEGKSCADGDSALDALCAEGYRCVNYDGAGARCLKTCTPLQYAVEGAGALEAAQCGQGALCWAYDGDGFTGLCGAGDCDADASETCGTGRFCQALNGTGRCLSSCSDLLSATGVGCTQGSCMPAMPMKGRTPDNYACFSAGANKVNTSCSAADPCVATTEGHAVLCLPDGDSASCGYACQADKDCPANFNQCALIYGTLGRCQ